MPWNRFCVPSVMMKGGSFSQWISRALHSPSAMPIRMAAAKGKNRLLMPSFSIRWVLT